MMQASFDPAMIWNYENADMHSRELGGSWN